MDELELVRLHEDGEHLVLGGGGGAQFTLPITEALRAAVRRDRPHLEHLRAEGERNLSPREIQSRLRAGDSVEDVADAAGLAVEHVRRFAGPVVAEQDYVVDRLRKSHPDHEEDSPTVDELVSKRLQARDVDPSEVEWSAARERGAQWVVTASFAVGSGRRAARWTYDPAARALHPLDDEARWLSGTDAPPDPTPGSLAVFDVDAATRSVRGGRTAPDDGTAELLDDLSLRRGIRPRTDPSGPTVVPEQEPFEGFGPQGGPGRDTTVEDPGASPGGTVVHLTTIRAQVPEPALEDADGQGGSPQDTDGASAADDGPHESSGADAERSDGGVDDRPGAARSEAARDPQGSASARPQAAREPRKGKNRSRAKVPSWDEIVFGARPES
jgi:hypothetical protein